MRQLTHFARTLQNSIAALACTLALTAPVAAANRDIVGRDQLIRVTVSGPEIDRRVRFELCPRVAGVNPAKLRNCRRLGDRRAYPIAELERLREDEKLKAVATGVAEGIAILSLGMVLPVTAGGLASASGGLAAKAGTGIWAGAMGGAALAPLYIFFTESDLNPFRRYDRAITLFGEKTLADEDVIYRDDMESLAGRLESKLRQAGRQSVARGAR